MANDLLIAIGKLAGEVVREERKLISDSAKKVTVLFRDFQALREEQARKRVAKVAAIELSGSAVRICQLERTPDQVITVKRFLEKKIALTESGPGGSIMIPLDQLLMEAEILRGRLALVLSGKLIFARTRSLPPVPREKVSKIIQYEITQQVPFMLKDIAIGYCTLSETDNGSSVIMGACKREVIDRESQPLRDVDWPVGAILINPLATFSWFRHCGLLPDPESGEIIAIADIGASHTEVICISDGLPRFLRPLSIGGNDFTSALVMKYRDFVAAEQFKLEAIDTKEVALESVLNRLGSELSRSLEYFRSQPGGGQVTRLLLTGGGANLSGLEEWLKKKLKIKVSKAALPQGDGSSAVMGGALYCMGEGINIDLR